MKAVSSSDTEKYGCISCGCDYLYSQGIRTGQVAPVICGECGERFIILADGLKKSPMGIGDPSVYPELEAHPRKGIAKHPYVRPDNPPSTGGEWWNPRGVGYDLSGFVKCKAAGERIVQMIGNVIGRKPESWLDYREREPNWIQVKIQAKDGFDLEKLNKLCTPDGIITIEKLVACLTKKFKVITLCGSTKFKQEFTAVQRELTLQGNIVISVGLFGHADNEYDTVLTESSKNMLDEMHRRKIDLSDEIFVINKNGYIGSSTKGEIEYAHVTHKKVSYLEPIE